MMVYEEVIRRVMSRRRFGKASGAEVTREMMRYLGYPEMGMRLIHIAGTNGKGSTAAFVSSILQAAGFCVGQFTSPHLVEFTERIQVNGCQISREDAARLGEFVLNAPLFLESTMFDLALAMAVLYFRERQCDFVVLETGLGGRLDSTNGLSQVPLVSVITNIGLEHTLILGDTIEKIAGEKGGILKQGCSAVFGEMDPAAHKVLTDICEQKKIPWKDAEKEQFGRLGLFGSYQKQNAATAAAAYEVIVEKCPEFFERKDADAILQKGLAQAEWPGRMEILSQTPFLMVDGAHNPQGVHALAESLKEAYPGEKFIFAVGILADKDYGKMLEEMCPLAEKFYTVTVESSRSLQGEAVAEYLQSRGQTAVFVSGLEECLRQVRRDCASGKKAVLFGSLYFVGSVEDLWRRKPDLIGKGEQSV